jgi:penicillin-binding protein 1A
MVWRFDRDGPKPRQVMPVQVAHDMNMMMNKVAEEGTGRRALLNGVRIAGKTGTTNAYRDAWFVAYSGNMVGGVWIGNDDYSSTNRMTGGSLPAMTWQAIMSYAHQGVELRPIPGLGPNPAPVPTPQTQAVASAGDRPPRPTLLTQRGAETLLRIERIMEEAGRKLVATGGTVSELPADPSGSPATDAFASAGGGTPPRAVRKN